MKKIVFLTGQRGSFVSKSFALVDKLEIRPIILRLLNQSLKMGLLAIVLVACNDFDEIPETRPLIQTNSSGVEEIGRKMLSDPTFLAILEEQQWINNQVELFYAQASRLDSQEVTATVISWDNKMGAREFLPKDTNVLKVMLGLPSQESLEAYIAEMDLKLSAFGEACSGLELSVAEWDTLANYLANRIVTNSTTGTSLADSLFLEFRRADCCCPESNDCSMLRCHYYNQCVSAAWSVYLGYIGAGTSVGTSGGPPGAALGFSFTAITGGVYLGYKINECWRDYLMDCPRDCGCEY